MEKNKKPIKSGRKRQKIVYNTVNAGVFIFAIDINYLTNTALYVKIIQ